MRNYYRRIVFAALLALSFPALAQGYWFVVWTESGEKVSYPLAEHPKVTHAGESLTVTTTVTTVEYSKAEVHKFTLNYESGTPSGVGTIPTCKTGEFTQHDNIVELSGFRAGSDVRMSFPEKS